MPSPELRPFQTEALRLLTGASRVDLICTAPTGAGKSRIFQEFGRNKRTLVLSPLHALNRQHAENLRALGLPVFDGVQCPRVGERGFWILSPEKLPSVERTLQHWAPEFVAVDEAHCVWDWGQTFRPALLEIFKCLTNLRVRPPTLWLSATFPQECRTWLRGAIERATGGPIVQCGNTQVPDSLCLRALRVPRSVRLPVLARVFKTHGGPGLIFSQTRKRAEALSEGLSHLGIAARPFHSGLPLDTKLEVLDAVRAGADFSLVATSAFGMGMDRHSFQWAAFMEAPLSLMALLQGLGRVGRRNRAAGIVLWDPADFALNEWGTYARWIARGQDVSERQSEVLRFLESTECRALDLAQYFGSATVACGQCDRCMK